eukprot:m.202162 g.202162  ORF g.202162 m.202162 type:complete len:78 (-) comp14976_c0_seq20:2373-2606(-)
MATNSSVLSAEQQKRLDDKKIETRIENERYLRNHPEIQSMVNDFVKAVLMQRPDSVETFAADYFERMSAPSESPQQS